MACCGLNADSERPLGRPFVRRLWPRGCERTLDHRPLEIQRRGGRRYYECRRCGCWKPTGRCRDRPVRPGRTCAPTWSVPSCRNRRACELRRVSIGNMVLDMLTIGKIWFHESSMGFDVRQCHWRDRCPCERDYRQCIIDGASRSLLGEFGNSISASIAHMLRRLFVGQVPRLASSRTSASKRTPRRPSRRTSATSGISRWKIGRAHV